MFQHHCFDIQGAGFFKRRAFLLPHPVFSDMVKVWVMQAQGHEIKTCINISICSNFVDFQLPETFVVQLVICYCKVPSISLFSVTFFDCIDLSEVRIFVSVTNRISRWPDNWTVENRFDKIHWSNPIINQSFQKSSDHIPNIPVPSTISLMAF